MNKNAVVPQFIQVNNDHKGIAILTLNRPEKRNALSLEMMKEIIEVLPTIESLEDKRVLIITGAEKIFCAGLDLKQLSDQSNLERFSHKIAKLLKMLYETPLITIAAVKGGAHGGGGGLVIASDIAIGGDQSTYSFPEVRRGLAANIIMPLLIRKLVQRDLAELLFIGEAVDAKKALDFRIINRVVQENAVMEEAFKIARNILKGSPTALKRTKALLRELYPSKLDHEMSMGIKSALKTQEDDEFSEGVRSYLEKRDPKWILS